MIEKITLASVDWADLAIIDFSEARTPEGRAKLAPQVRDAMRTVGFLCVVNHGVTQAQVSHIHIYLAYISWHKQKTLR